MIDFLEEALEAHTSPESLDQPLPLLRPSAWAMLFGLLLFNATIVAWSVWGRIPVRIEGRGVLMFPDALVTVQSPSGGLMQRILVREGQCVGAGQILAHIDLVPLRGRVDGDHQRSSVVVSPGAGCLVEKLVQPGAVVAPGAPLFSLDHHDPRRQIVSLAYFPSQDGKRLKPGQRVRITPNTTQVERHGGIRGRILSLSTLPVSREGLRQRLGLESLVASVQPPGSGGNEPLIEAITTLERNPRTRSGFDWGGGPGPDLTITPGTNTEVSVEVDSRQPISYVIPLLRQISGIY